MPEPGDLEGEILQQRYAVVKVHSCHGDWVRCRVYDMQGLAQREAMVRIGAGGPEVELLPEDHTPVAPPPTPSSVRGKPRAGRLEAAWFAAGADTEAIPEEDRPVEDGDIVIAPSKVEQAASDITTGAYMRYRLDTTSNRTPAVDAGVLAVPLRSGHRRLLLPLLLGVAGVGLVLALLLLLL